MKLNNDYIHPSRKSKRINSKAKKKHAVLIILVVLAVLVAGCGPGSTPTVIPEAADPTSVPSKLTLAPPTPTSVPQGETIIVTSSEDSGPGTLRQALLDAQSGDIITFDPVVFPPDSPINILLERELPFIVKNYITIDASSAVVILDGSNITTQYANGLQISSKWCVIQGLQFVGFTGAGIVLSGGAQYNKIGGDQNIGIGPSGQGNVFGYNEAGIGIWGNQTSNNTLLGNLIGIDSTETIAWENSIGIYIEDGGSYNIIGPGNIIAFNSVAGIQVVHKNSLGNSITQNNIYSNGTIDIGFSDGGNTELTAPIIFGFNLDSGVIGGNACKNCIIEFFSTDEHSGKTFEGQTTANNEGFFTFSKDSSFNGTNLTATATNIDGSTSNFSIFTTGKEKSIFMQEGNDDTVRAFYAKPSNELQDNRLGEMHFIGCTDVNTASEYINRVQMLGLKWIRVSVDTFDIAEVKQSGEYSEFQINDCKEEAIDLLYENEIIIHYTINFWDSDTADQVLNPGYTRFQVEDEIQRYLEYVQFIVNHFKGRIQYYEILNEPESPYLGQYVEVDDYVELIKRTIPIIHQADPEAKIVVGATSDLLYLFGVIEADVMPLVDAISWHPVYGASPEYDTYKEYYPGLFTNQYYYDLPSIVQLIRDTAFQHGFRGEFFPTELVWRSSLNPHIFEYDEYSPIAVAKYYGRGIVMHLGMGLTTGIGLDPIEGLPGVVAVIRNLSTLLAGAEPTNFLVEIKSDVPIIANYNFVLSNGDRLVAIWSDGIAVDNDPGERSTVIINGLSAEKVVGIDVLNSIEQELIFSTEDGNLVIRDLLIKDYPIILRLTP